MKKRGERPGVMLYFDSIRPAINRLDREQCGALLQAVLDYAQYGAVPELDPMTGLAFDMLIPKLDQDAERYEETREHRQYAAYSREKRKIGAPVLSLEEWRLTRPRADVSENTGPISPVHNCAQLCPSTSTSTTTTPSTTTTTTTSPSTTASPSPSPAAAGEGCKGEGEVRALYRSWISALNANDDALAQEYSDRLLALGHYADKQTRLLRKRPRPPGGWGELSAV